LAQAKDVEEDKVEWPIPRRVLRRRQREALLVIERVFWEEGFSEFGYDEECEVFFDHEGNVVLTRHYADRRLLEERGSRERRGGARGRAQREPRSGAGGPREATERPWWRKMFGG
jgi:hypothetical protein